MTTSKIQQDIQGKVAGWLCDEFGSEGETDQMYKADARDLLAFMKSNGYRFTPVPTLVRERQPF